MMITVDAKLEVSFILSTMLSWSLSLFARCLNSAPLYHQVGCDDADNRDQDNLFKKNSRTGSKCVEALHWMDCTDTGGRQQVHIGRGDYCNQSTDNCWGLEKNDIWWKWHICWHQLKCWWQLIFDYITYLMTATDALMKVDVWWQELLRCQVLWPFSLLYNRRAF